MRDNNEATPQEYFDDPAIVKVQQKIVQDILFFSFEKPASVQDHIASQYSNTPKEKDVNSNGCTETTTESDK
jgi:hypothetical protein